MDRRVFFLALFALPFGVEESADAAKKRKRSARQRTRRSKTRYDFMSSSNSGYYSSCSEARAAGAAPIREGQKGYSRRLDRDGDGVACE